MAYLSSTTTAPNVPALLQQGVFNRGVGSSNPSTDAGGSQGKLWRYSSTHTQAAVAGTGFFSDGQKLGMSYNDVVLVVGSTTFVQSQHIVNLVTSTGATVSAGLLVSSAS